MTLSYQNTMKTIINPYFTTFKDIFRDNSHVLSVISFTFLTVTVLWLVYKKIRCRFPLKVNCWFCNSFSSVPYECANSWTCPSCDQYNGFTKEGDYNKTISEQFDTSINSKVFNALKNAFTPTTSKSNGFCRLCNINQQLKIQQLALFVPIDERNYDIEIEEFKEKLEKSYRLCARCEATLEKTLDRQNYHLLKDRLDANMNQAAGCTVMAASPEKHVTWRVYSLPQPLKQLLKGINMAVLAVVAVLSLFKVHSQPGFLFDIYPVLMDGLYLEMACESIREVYPQLLHLSAVGCITSLSLVQRKQECKVTVLWTLLCLLAWVQSDTCVVVQQLTVLWLVLRELPQLQQQQRLVKQQSSEREVPKQPRTPPSVKPPKLVERVIERGISGLSLGLERPESERGTNFLFEKHDYVNRAKYNPSSLLRPSRLSSWSSEWADPPTRSSTPSSGYSSQKMEPSHPAKTSYEPYWMNLPVEDCQRPQSVYSYQTTPPHYPMYRYSPTISAPPTPDFYSTSGSYKPPRSTFYTLSIGLNLATLVMFAYAVYSGVISIYWQLPRFEINF